MTTQLQPTAYRALIDRAADLDPIQTLFDGSASLVRGDMRDLIRDQIRGDQEPDRDDDADIKPPIDPPSKDTDKKTTQPPIIPTLQRHARVRLNVADLPIAKTTNLQPYLFKPLQEQDAGARITIAIEVTSAAGVTKEILEDRIVEGLGQLGIDVDWEPA